MIGKKAIIMLQIYLKDTSTTKIQQFTVCVYNKCIYYIILFVNSLSVKLIQHDIVNQHDADNLRGNLPQSLMIMYL